MKPATKLRASIEMKINPSVRVKKNMKTALNLRASWGSEIQVLIASQEVCETQ
jgi:hypothetical protein